MMRIAALLIHGGTELHIRVRAIRRRVECWILIIVGELAFPTRDEKVAPSVINVKLAATPVLDMMPAMAGKRLNPVDQHVGARLRERRVARGISQGELGRLSGITFQQVQKYEKGVNLISASRLQEFAGALKVTPEYFFDGLRTASSNPKAMAYVEEFKASPEGLALSRAFQLIDDPRLRRSIVALVAQIARP
jgi:transcriptional regulator with XRE-family HTH domain